MQNQRAREDKMKTFWELKDELNEDMTHMTIRNGADGMSSSDKASHKKEYKKKFGVTVKHSGNNVTYSGKKANVTKAARDHFPDHKDDGMPNDIHKWHDGKDIHVKKEGYMSESMLGHRDAEKLNGGKSRDPNFKSPESHIDHHHRQSGGHNKSGGDQDRHRYQVAKKLGYDV
jgi:hypothetical protein